MNKKTHVQLVPLHKDDREQFIRDNQEAFNYGALEEFGRRDEHFEEDGQIISRATIEQAIDAGEDYRIVHGGHNNRKSDYNFSHGSTPYANRCGRFCSPQCQP
ncbi:MAG: hypothetical protein IKZ87_03395 [Actinomycetaceae bacterium]|nr:hypothetical protein [Actinomycetaceae bacterium]